MFERILVPLDGTPDGESILPHLPRLSISKADIFLLHVLPHLHPTDSASMRPLFDLPEYAESYLEKVADGLKDVRPFVFVDSGDPADRILRVAQALEVGLIAMASHARKGIPGLVWGNVARRVVQGSSIPLLLARPDTPVPSRPLRHVLVPLDGSDRSLRILKVVASAATRLKFEVTLLHVRTPESDPMAGMLPDRTWRMRTQECRQRFERAAEPLQDAGLETRVLIVSGDAGKEIPRHAEALKVDLIALATHGRSGLDRMVAGSVAEEVLRKAAVPVLTLRAVGAPEPLASERNGR
ncbi:MAG: universal stress protein [Planctomycetes bacterium]|nr:universal stress protein [Planctomycetota bacterium]